MKAGDFKPCAICGRGMMHAGVPLFFRVKIEHMGVDLKAVERTAGLEMMFGGGVAGAKLARIMGPDPDLAKPMMEPQQLLVCHPCALKPVPLLALTEREGATIPPA